MARHFLKGTVLTTNITPASFTTIRIIRVALAKVSEHICLVRASRQLICLICPH
ncbi:hypothetical protein [Thermosynechococcus sp. OHK43]|uniref:hypothetical protein n=1 Tax=Thermosynechococcus sp. OHK43 TaxID=2763133 RepID=UPI0025D45FAF|nr:hypothetical protein [Thermosynechococcus sp. OHK43]